MLWKRREKMGLLDKLWDDVMAGPVPREGHGLDKLRKINTLNLKEGEGEGSKVFERSLTMPTGPETPASLPTTPTTPSPTAMRKDQNVWRSVFHPGSNLASKGIGGAVFDKPHPNSPTVYDWLYSGETKCEHRGG